MNELDELLTPFEHTRRALHRSIDRICDAWPQAVEDAAARGYPTSVDYNVIGSSSSETTSVEAAALNPSKAVAWLAELADVLDRYNIHDYTVTTRIIVDRMHQAVQDDNLSEHTIRITIRLANIACLLWPPPAKHGTTSKGVTVGARTNSIELCGLCDQPVTGGHADPIRRIDGTAFHGKNCWFTVTRQRKEAR